MLNSKMLRQAAKIADKIGELQTKMQRLLDGKTAKVGRRKRKMSAAGRRAIRKAQKARWAAKRAKAAN